MTTPIPPSEAPTRAPARFPGFVLGGIEILVLVVVLVAAWRNWNAWPVVPQSDPDTWGYLSPALSWLNGDGFRQADGRDWLYPAFLALFLKSTGSFAGIAVWQKLIALASGIVMAVTWRGWVSLLPFGRPWRFVLSLLGALPIYVQLINQQNTFFVMSIRPEAVLGFFVYAQLACVIGYTKYRWQTPRAVPSMLFGGGAIFLAYACYLLKPSWYFAFGTTSLPVFIGFFGKSLPRVTKFLTPVLGLVLCALFLWLPAKVFFVRDGTSRILLPDALFCVHAPLIDKLFQARLAKLSDSDPEKARLQAFVTVLESELKTSLEGRRIYAKLHINADYLMHSSIMSGAIYAYAGNDRGDFSAFCIKSYLEAVLHYPGEYTAKVIDQFEYFLFPEPNTYFKDQMGLQKSFRSTADSLAPFAEIPLRPDLHEMFHQYLQGVDAQIKANPVMERDRKLRGWTEKFSPWTLPLEIAFIVALLEALFYPPLRPLRLGGWGALFLFLAPFGNAFGVCIVHTLDIYRYRVTYGGFLLFALTAMTAFTIAVIACPLWKLRAVKAKESA